MIAVILFYLHVMFLLYSFVRSYQTDGILQALLSSAFIITLFSVGWTITELLVSFVIPPEGYGLFFPRDAFSLILLTIIETAFYYFYFKKVTPAVTN